MREFEPPHFRFGPRGFSNLRDYTAGIKGQLGHDFLTAIVLDLLDGDRVQSRSLYVRDAGRIKFPEGAGQANSAGRYLKLETIAGWLVQRDFRGGAWKTAPAKTVAGMHRTRIWKRRRRRGRNGGLPRRSSSGAVQPEQRNRSQPNSRDHSHNTYRARKNTRTRRVFFQVKITRERYGFFGLDAAGEVVVVVVAGLVARSEER